MEPALPCVLIKQGEYWDSPGADFTRSSRLAFFRGSCRMRTRNELSPRRARASERQARDLLEKWS